MDIPPVRPTTSRQFGLSDLMILVAAAALGLGILRADGSGTRLLETAKIFMEKRDSPWFHVTRVLLTRIEMVAAPPLLMTTLAVLLMRFRNPRPRWRRLVRQPGFVAGLAMFPAWPIVASGTLREVFSWRGGTLPVGWLAEWIPRLSRDSAPTVGLAVIVAWATLRLVGRWRAEPSAIDRLGRACGAAWITLLAMDVVENLLWVL
jgi:hypothetical protein